ncbi:hypothetical protein CN395_28585 [Priestia megaterium]|uniref:hypothetical protein n=1 Tax=Priestia megaterium TaxID=1404 RepID=UPI000BF95E7D|nr:hypothetical protein [Priestia megaterium]PEU51606.1 hypothetical protein CN395_28585 [Priestia megaterium]
MPNKEYLYYLIKLGKLYYVNESCRNVKRKEISSYEFTNDELVSFPFDTQSIAKQTTDECGGYIVVRNATFEDYIREGERWSKYIDYKEKHVWKLYNVK